MKILKGIMVLMAGLFFLGFATNSEPKQTPDFQKIEIDKSTPTEIQPSLPPDALDK